MKKNVWSENALFAFLGMLCAMVVCLGSFGVVDNRAPASLEQAVAQDFQPLVYIYD